MDDDDLAGVIFELIPDHFHSPDYAERNALRDLVQGMRRTIKAMAVTTHEMNKSLMLTSYLLVDKLLVEAMDA